MDLFKRILQATDLYDDNRVELNDGGRAAFGFGDLVRETKSQLDKEKNSTARRDLKRRLDFLLDTKERAKNVKGSKLILSQLDKKDKLGRPYFSSYLENLRVLEELQENQYKNPKTNKPYTPKEWLALGRNREKQKDPEKFKEKKNIYQKKYFRQRKKDDPEFAEKQKFAKKESYFRLLRKRKGVGKDGKGVLLEQRNRLLRYMSEASKNNPNYQDIVKNGKFVGVKDIQNNINYYEAGYKGKLGKNSKLITDHPNWKQTDNLVKLANSYKVSLPNKAISSYFSAYERVPTLAEMQNFLQADPRFVKQMSPNYFKSNPLHLHHQISVTDNPTEKMQLLLQDKNDQAGKAMSNYKSGIINEKQLNTELKKLNTRYFLNGKPIGAAETSPEMQLRTAKTQTAKLFNKKLAENPKLIEEMTQALGILGCGNRIKAALGGRVKFSEGSSCVTKGRQKLENIILKGGGSQKEKSLAQVILNTGRSLGSGFTARGLFGPAALAFTAATEAGLVGYDMLSKGQTFREAVGDSLFNYALGDKTKIDPKQERYKRYQDVGFNQEQIGKIAAFENQIDELNQLSQNFAEFGQAAQSLTGTGSQRLNPLAREKAEQKVFEEYPAFNQDIFRAGVFDRLNIPQDEGARLYGEAEKMSALQKLGSTGPQIMGTIFPKFEEQRQEDIANILRGGLSSGGVAEGPPPESGPTPDGLPNLFKRVRNY